MPRRVILRDARVHVRIDAALHPGRAVLVVLDLFLPATELDQLIEYRNRRIALLSLTHGIARGRFRRCENAVGIPRGRDA